MELLEYAKQLEQTGISYYQRERNRSDHSGFREVLSLLIHEEQEHYAIFERLARQDAEQQVKTTPSPFVPRRNAFQLVTERKAALDFSSEHIETLKKVLEIEKNSEAFYRQALSATNDKEVRKRVLQVANEELRHVSFVDHLLKSETGEQ